MFNALKSVSAGMLMSLAVASCASPDESGTSSIIEYKLDKSVGSLFSGSDWNKPTGAKRQEITNDGSRKEYEYIWLNKCSFAISVDIASGKITGWRYTSDPQLCRNIKAHTFGT